MESVIWQYHLCIPFLELWMSCGHLPTPLVEGQTSRVYSSNPVQYLSISCYVTVNKQGLQYLSLRLLPQWWPQRDWSLWPCLRRASSRTITRPLCRQCDNPAWSHTALLSWFHVHCRPSFWLHNRRSRLQGGALWRACNLTAFIHSSAGQSRVWIPRKLASQVDSIS
jgi:hypothetical protein